jgi:hypothetical protein
VFVVTDTVKPLRRKRSGHSASSVCGRGGPLALADLDLAIGTDSAIQASELTVVRGDLTAAVDAIRLSRPHPRDHQGQPVLGFAHNVAVLPPAAFGLLNPMIAGAAVAFSAHSSSPTACGCTATADRTKYRHARRRFVHKSSTYTHTTGNPLPRALTSSPPRTRKGPALTRSAGPFV